MLRSLPRPDGSGAAPIPTDTSRQGPPARLAHQPSLV